MDNRKQWGTDFNFFLFYFLFASGMQLEHTLRHQLPLGPCPLSVLLCLALLARMGIEECKAGWGGGWGRM